MNCLVNIRSVQTSPDGQFSIGANNTIDRLEKDVFPWIGKSAITDIEAPDILAVLRRIEQRGANELAHTAKRVIGQVFRYAIATERTIRNPVPDLQGALSPVIVTHHAAITEPVPILGESLFLRSPSRPESLVRHPTRGGSHHPNDSTRFRDALHFHYAKSDS